MIPSIASPQSCIWTIGLATGDLGVAPGPGLVDGWIVAGADTEGWLMVGGMRCLVPAPPKDRRSPAFRRGNRASIERFVHDRAFGESAYRGVCAGFTRIWPHDQARCSSHPPQSCSPQPSPSGFSSCSSPSPFAARRPARTGGRRRGFVTRHGRTGWRSAAGLPGVAGVRTGGLARE